MDISVMHHHRASGIPTPSSDSKVEMKAPSVSPQPRFYVVRPDPNKALVPLIALDELPSIIRLQGVPLTLDAKIINDWNMARVGDTTPHQGQYEVLMGSNDMSGQQELSDSSSLPESTGDTKNQNGGHGTNVALTSRGGQVGVKQSWVPLSQVQGQMRDAASNLVERNLWEKDNDPSKTKDAMTPGVFGKKKYCTHWIRTGNCDYVQEGCKYLHVIPDEDTRLQIGIRDMPRWAKEDLPMPQPPPVRKGPPFDASNKQWRRNGRQRSTEPSQSSKGSVKSTSSKAPTPYKATSQTPKQGVESGGNNPSKSVQKPTRILTNSSVGAARPSMQTPATNGSQVMNKNTSRQSSSSVKDSFQRQLLNNSTPMSPQSTDGSIRQDTGIYKNSSRFSVTSSGSTMYNSDNSTAADQYRNPANGNVRTVNTYPNYFLEPSATSNVSNGLNTPPPSQIQSPVLVSETLGKTNGGSPNLEFQDVKQQQHVQAPMNTNGHVKSEPTYVLPERFARQQPSMSQPQSSTMTPASSMHNSNVSTPNKAHDFGVIGSGRPMSNYRDALQQPKPTTDLPVHRRLFVKTGEDEYIVSQPEEEKPKQSRSSKKKSGPKGRGKTGYESENLINFDAEHSTDES